MTRSSYQIILLEHGAEYKATNLRGATPLMYAAARGKRETCLALLSWAEEQCKGDVEVMRLMRFSMISACDCKVNLFSQCWLKTIRHDYIFQYPLCQQQADKIFIFQNILTRASMQLIGRCMGDMNKRKHYYKWLHLVFQ